MEGWIKLYRKSVENPLYFSEPFTRWQAWADMILIANHIDGFFFKRGIKVNVGRGQIGYDLDTLAKRWKWSRGKVERFFCVLEIDKQIARQKNNVSTLITILNYDLYQGNDKANDKANGQQTINQTDINKNEKNNKNDNMVAKATVSDRKEKFYNTLIPFLSAYSKDMIREFFDYWTELNKSQTKMRFEMEKTWETKKRLTTWSGRCKVEKRTSVKTPEGEPKGGW